MSTKAKSETDRLIESAGGARSEPGGRAQRPVGGARLEIPEAVRDRLSDEVIDERSPVPALTDLCPLEKTNAVPVLRVIVARAGSQIRRSP